MVPYRMITLLALAVTGAIAAPCEAGAAASGAGAAANAQATGAAGASGATGSGGASTGGGAGAGAAGGSCPPTTTNESLGPSNVGVAGKQFVTGQCTSDANCASNCCVFGGGSDRTIAVCRNEPALKPTESCGFTCAAA